MATRKKINTNIERKLYAESMGRCMNPKCKVKLFSEDTGKSIGEMAHIKAHAIDQDDSYDNLILLCPNCHTEFDKNYKFSIDEVKQWKEMRKNEIQRLFCKKFETFNELKQVLQPLLVRNKLIYENYFCKGEKELWDKFEDEILVNNRKIRLYLENNKHLIQKGKWDEYSNLYYIDMLIAHIKEFEVTRSENEKFRSILFPKEINSIFGVVQYEDNSPYTFIEPLEELVKEFIEKNKSIEMHIGEERPYILINQDKIYLNDTPYIRQLLKNNGIWVPGKVRTWELNNILKYLKCNEIQYKFADNSVFRKIIIGEQEIEFIYTYILSKNELTEIAPKNGSVIVNLHHWNGDSSISKAAKEYAENIGVKLLTRDEFYGCIRENKFIGRFM